MPSKLSVPKRVEAAKGVLLQPTPAASIGINCFVLRRKKQEIINYINESTFCMSLYTKMRCHCTIELQYVFQCWRSVPFDRTGCMHDDVIKWEHFPRYWPFVRGIHQSPVNSPHNGRWHEAYMVSFICAWTNGWVNNRDAGYSLPLWRHCNEFNNWCHAYSFTATLLSLRLNQSQLSPETPWRQKITS